MSTDEAEYAWDDAFTAPTDFSHSAGLFVLLMDYLDGYFEGAQPVHEIHYTRPLNGKDGPVGALYTFWLEGHGSREDPDCLWHIYPIASDRTRFVGYCFHPALQGFCDGVIDYFEGLFPEIKQQAPSEAGSTGDSPRPKIPARPSALGRWKAIWRLVAPQWHSGKGYKTLVNWLAEMHSDLTVGERTLREILKAGEAGLLD